MKRALQSLFKPLLNLFENQSDEFILRPSNRKICFAISACFLLLTVAMPVVSGWEQIAAMALPMLVFGGIGFVGVVVASLGSEHAVAKLLGSRRK